MKKRYAVYFLTGVLIGAAMTVPGVSGGTLAVICGIYTPLLRAIDGFLKTPRQSAALLGVTGAGLATGFAVTARLIALISGKYGFFLSFFFMGSIIGGIVVLAVREKKKFRILYFLIGMLSVILMHFLPTGILTDSGNGVIFSFLTTVLTGLMMAIALILPGVSLSLMMILIGNYQTVINAVAVPDLKYLMPLALSTVFGTILLGKLFSRLLERFPEQVGGIVLGFAAASVGEVYPGLPGRGSTFFCAIILAAGFIAAWGSFFLFKKRIFKKI